MYNRSNLEVEFLSTFSSIIEFLKYSGVSERRDCYSAMRRGVAKIYSELVSLRLLYIMMPNKILKIN